MAEDLMERLRTLAHPCAEVLPDEYRLRQFIRLAHEMDGRLIDPTTLTEAVAAARAEGVREGLERAAAYHDEWQARNASAGCPTSARRHHKYAANIRALIPAPPSLTPGGRTDG